ncbi:MAG: two-component regulator propeller domain-containing protein, partial [Pseudomonadota bacterium]
MIREFFTTARTAWAVGAALLGLATVASADTEISAEQPMLFSHISVDQGLSQSNVLAILQDSDGLMWFATEDGLNRYDGHRFTHFKRERGNPDALVNDFIFDAVEDKRGSLWLATNGGGLSRLNRETGAVETFLADGRPGSLSSNLVRRVAIDDDGIVWVATRDAGLDRYDPSTGIFENISLNDPAAPTDLPGARPAKLYTLHIDRRGLLWVGGDHGLTAIDTQTGQQVPFVHDPANPRSLQDGSVRAIWQLMQPARARYGMAITAMVVGTCFLYLVPLIPQAVIDGVL